MRIKGKLKDFVILSDDNIEQTSIIKWTNMLKDDPEAIILITNEPRDLPKNPEDGFPHLYEEGEKSYGFLIQVKRMEVIGQTKNVDF